MGAQTPRLCSVPQGAASSSGAEAIELARLAGLLLDPWEEFVLAHSLGEREDGKWAAFEVGLCVPRQNGKGAVLEARELAGLFLLDERLLIHSAHEFPTSLEAFRRLLTLIEDTPDLDRRVQRVSRSHGEEGIELKRNPRTGLRQRIRFRTRTKGGGRGFSGDLLVLDEAMFLPESAHGALLPTLSARPNPQVWYTGSAVDEEEHDDGVVFARVRERGLKGDPALLYAEWSVDEREYTQDPDRVARDPEAWARSNPGLGIRISAEHVAREQRSMAPRKFAVERLNVGFWPATDGNALRVIDAELWAAALDTSSSPGDPVCFAIDTTPDRAWSSIGVAGFRADGFKHIEIVERRRGTGWVVSRLGELIERHAPRGVVADGSGPVASLTKELEEASIDVTWISTKEHSQACGSFFDDIDQGRIRHLGTPELTLAVGGAVKRQLADAWAWSRRNSAVDISPLVAVTFAAWGLDMIEAESVPPMAVWA